MDPMTILIATVGIVGTVIGLVVGFMIDRMFWAADAKEREAATHEKLRSAEIEAEHLLTEARLKLKDELLEQRQAFDQAMRERRQELQEWERTLKGREEGLEKRLDSVQQQLADLTRRGDRVTEQERQIEQKQQDLKALEDEKTRALENVAGLPREEAREELLERLKHDLASERGLVLRQHEEELKQTCQRQARQLLVEVMQRHAGQSTFEHTTSTVPLPSDEMKGRIIGREGRNIRVFENITGVSVLIDDTPSAVVLSCHDPVRRHVARLSLERLVADGRIHPSRVEEIVDQARDDVTAELRKAGDDAVSELQLVEVAPAVIDTLGRLKHRHSYAQNVLMHSLEVGRFMGLLAGELGLDVAAGKRMGLLHDIGKALDHEQEGPHAVIGMEFLRRHGEDPVILNGVGCHHDDVPAESPLAALVSVADTLSASRPGARSETTEIYLERLERLEEIGCSFPGVDHCFAVQAGREIRVVVEPERISENQAAALSHDIAARIERELQYPGQVKVCVIRETRAVQYAR